MPELVRFACMNGVRCLDLKKSTYRGHAQTNHVGRGEFKQRFDFGFLLTDQIFIKKGQNRQFEPNKIFTKISKITFAQNYN